MKELILGLIVVFLMGCSGDITIEEAAEIMPPGYKILCSVEGGKYALWMPHSLNRDVWFRSATVWDSKERTAAFAVYWEKVRGIPYVPESSKYEWDECPE